MEINPLNISNLSHRNGLGGIIRYVLARFYTIQNEKKDNPFDNDFLERIYKRVETILYKKEMHTNIDLFVEFKLFYELKKISRPSIYDISSLIYPENFDRAKLNEGLDGLAGLGMKVFRIY